MSEATISAEGCSSSRWFSRTSPWTSSGSSLFTSISQSLQPRCAGRLPCAGPPAPADDLDRAGQVLEREEAEAGALLLVLPLAQVADHAHHRDLVPLPLPLHLGAVGGGVAAGLLLVAGQRVAGDVEAERLLLGGEPHPLRPLRRPRRRPPGRPARGSGASSRRRAGRRRGSPGRSAGRRGPTSPAERAASIPAASLQRGTPSKSKAPLFTSASMTFLFTRRGSMREQKSKRLLKGPPSSRGGQHGLDGAVAHALHGAQAEADAAASSRRLAGGIPPCAGCAAAAADAP